MNSQRTFKILAVFTALVLILTACQSPTQAPEATQPPVQKETTFERAKREGIIRVGFANENPFAYAQPDGTLAGEAVDIAKEIFAALGIPKMEGVLTEFGSLIPGLLANRFDAITAGMYIKPERCAQVLFANPEYAVGSGLVVQKGNPFNLHSYEDIAANPQVRVGTGAGYFEVDYLKGSNVAESQIVLFPDNPSGIAGLKANQIDTFTATSVGLSTLLKTSGDTEFEMALPFTDPVINGKPVTGYSGTAFRKEDADLQAAFNTELKKLADSGKLLEILTKYGFTSQNLPGVVTAEQACTP
jgi:polar amino acid transport system substrate-binding protein